MVFRLQVRDNIGFGNIDAVDDMKRIRNAAEAGGALEFIEKLSGGFDSKIEATYATWSSLSRAKEDGPLQTQVKSLEEKLEISGGQWQRLAISRSFMRVLNNDRVRLMCYDEPSSALDPKAEFGQSHRSRLTQFMPPVLNERHAPRTV